MSNKCVEFSNPENLPVEKLTLSVTNAGVVQQIKALEEYGRLAVACDFVYVNVSYYGHVVEVKAR